MLIIKIYLSKIITFFNNGIAIILRESDNIIILKLREIFRNSAINTINNILNLGINFIIVVLFARYLGAEALGQYALATSLSGIVLSIANFGLQGILTREVAKNSNKAQEYLGNSLGIRLLVSLPLGVGFTCILAVAMGFQGEILKLIFLASIFVGLSGIIGIFYGLFQAVNKFEYQFLFNLFYKIASVLGCFFLLQKGYGLISVIVLFIVLQIFTGLLVAIKIFQKICSITINVNWRFWRSFIQESLPLALSGTAEFINLKSDTVILGAIKSAVATGIYNGAYNIYLGVNALPHAFIVAFYPTFSRTYKDSKGQAFRLFKNVFFLIAIGACILAFVLAIFSNYIVTLIYGQEFSASAIPLIILTCGLPFMVLNRLCNYTLIAMGLQGWMFRIISSGAIFNVVANILLIPKYSYVGASITTVITEGLIFFAALWKIYYSFNELKSEEKT